MKFLLAFALFAVASAGVLPPAIIASENPEIQEIVAAIQSPSTDPSTAAALEQMLLELLGLHKPEPIEVGPAIVEGNEPISIGPAIIDFPVTEDGTVSEVHPAPVQPAPVQPAPVGPQAGSPLVQIILNVNAASNFPGAPVTVEHNPAPAPTPVQVVEEAEAPESVIVVESADAPEQVIVVESADAPEQVIVVEEAAAAPEPVIVAEPIVPVPVINLPETLN